MENQSYFWSNYDPSTVMLLDTKLVYDRYFIPLIILYAIFQDEHKIIPKSHEERNSKDNYEKFLAYLLPLLEQKKLKVKIRDLIRTPATEKEKRQHGNTLSPNFVHLSVEKEYLDLSPQNAINMIRDNWNKLSKDSERSHFEEWGVMFTLPENDWVI